MSAVYSFVGTSPVFARSFTARGLLCNRVPRSRHRSLVNATRVAMNAELITPAEANARKGDGSWSHVDVRSEGEYAQGHPPATTNIPFLLFGALGPPSRNPDFVSTFSEKFDKSRPVVLSCQSGKRSAMAADVLKQAGFEKLADIEGGYAAWTQDSSLPVEK
jgi:phage shock protein E